MESVKGYTGLVQNNELGAISVKKFDQINMIPFIDIMLVLLAIVLTTASFVSKGLIEVDLPSADQSLVIEELKQPIEIALTAEGQLYFNDQEIDVIDLGEHLVGLDKSVQIQLRIDQSAQFKGFIQIVNDLKAYELENFSIETQLPQS